MILNCSELENSSSIRAKVCVIGSGAAGIALALKLAREGIQVALLEAGDRESTEQSSKVYEATSVKSGPTDTDFNASYPGWSRLRFYGGSTNHWGGWCRPLDGVDFTTRPWLEQSGWPIRRSDIASHYETAAEMVEIDPFNLVDEDQHPTQDFSERSDPLSESVQTEIEQRYFHFSPPTRFAEKFNEEIQSSLNLTLYLNASVTHLNSASDGSAVTSATVTRYDRSVIRVEADHFVLACGGLENPRLLLNYSRQGAARFGNEFDNVGAYFMDHPHADMGVFINTQDVDWLKPYKFNGLNPIRVLTTSQNFQVQNQTLNFSCSIGTSRMTLQHEDSIRNLAEQFGTDSVIHDSYLKLFARTEMEPQKRNRIYLSNEQDSLGLNRLSMDVRYSDLDRYSLQKSVEAVIRHFSAAGLGRGRLAFDKPGQWPEHIGGGCHHIGTTRMSADPRLGVVDSNCRVHGMKNMYVAGSSVFPTGGYANPTLTLVALSLRLADHLSKELMA